MSAILNEGLNCVAITSISTGNMGLPAEAASLIELRGIQKFLRANHFEGSLAIVCLEDHVFHAFNQSKESILKGFNKEIDLLKLESINIQIHQFIKFLYNIFTINDENINHTQYNNISKYILVYFT
jgi:hypothetical protein